MQKWMLTFLFAFTLLFFVPVSAQTETPTATVPSARERLHTIQDYVVYYGAGRGTDLAKFDFAIIQPETLTMEELEALKQQGTLVVAYLSLGEVEPYREWFTDGRYQAEWGLGENTAWGSIMVDAGQTGWQELMLTAAGEYLAKGFDGIFMDTIDTVDVYPDTEGGMIDLIHKLRTTYPEAILVQNRGFAILDRTVDDIDSIMFEDLSTTYDFDKSQYLPADNSEQAEMLKTVMDESGIVVLALDYAEPGDDETARRAIETAQSYGFVPAIGTILLDDITFYDVVGSG